MNKILFLGGFFPNELRQEIEAKSLGVIQYAADSLQQALIQGISAYIETFVIINSPYIGSFPSRYKDIKMKSFNFKHNNIHGINVGFINLPLFKLYSRYINVKKLLLNDLNNNFQNNIIVIYAIHTPFIKVAVHLKKIYPNIKICLIVPDLPEFMGGSNNVLYRLLKKIDKKILDKLLPKIDAFVLLSDYMHKPLSVQNRPWVRVEGIFSGKEDTVVLEKEQFKTILYSGTLARRYGIINLLNAFVLIQDQDYRLWICGDGDAKDELNEKAKIDNRIINFGQIPREQVLELQKRATVLVNPRTSEGEFTKYSFPSKTMEYLASGTPCIMNKLKGIPQEYFKFIFFPENESVFELSQIIIEICKKEQSELNKIGELAKRFIFENKTPDKQCEKIYNMLKKL